MIKIAVCDNDKITLESIARTVEKVFNNAGVSHKLDSYSDGNQLLNNHKDKQYNILILDVNMPEKRGFEVAKKARLECKDVFIIFVTSNAELVYESFDYQPFQFVRKNTETGFNNDVAVAVRKLIAYLRQFEGTVLETSPGRKSSVLYRDIMYIKSDKHYLEYYISDGTVVKQRGIMSEVEIELAEHSFIKVHKRNLVNMRYIKSIDNKMLEIILQNNTRLEMSRNCKAETEEKYIKFMRSLI